jgi:hypothetical protein
MIDGKPVVDADKPVTVHITSEDCDESRVHLGCTYLRFGNKWLRYATPPSLKAEIISFDRGGGFYPGDFRLHPMPAALRLKPVNPKRAPKRSRATANAAQRVKAEKKKSEPRVFPTVQGVRERANARET